MNVRYSVKMLLICVVTWLCVLPAESVASEQEVVASMRLRLPAIMKLKMSGRIGETNQGFLEAREHLEREAYRLLLDENQDRRVLYGAIAARLKLSLSRVQAERAEDIRERSPQSVWLQSVDGQWFRK